MRAYTENMDILSFSERETNCRYIAYLASALVSAFRGISAEVAFDGGRVRLTLRAKEEDKARLHALGAEKVAEVLCIGYKYNLLSSLVHPAGLSGEEREILLAAIISADFAEDRKYVCARLSGVTEHSVDGFYLFRLRRLQEKWRSVAACVPPSFTRAQLHDFMEYLLGGCRGKVFLKGQEVYDSRCRRLRRAQLIDGGRSEINTRREIILSGAGKVECLSALSAGQEDFLKKYYAGRVGFGV